MSPAAAAVKREMRGGKRNHHLFSCPAVGVFTGKRRRGDKEKKRRRTRTKTMSPLEFKWTVHEFRKASGGGETTGKQGKTDTCSGSFIVSRFREERLTNESVKKRGNRISPEREGPFRTLGSSGTVAGLSSSRPAGKSGKDGTGELFLNILFGSRASRRTIGTGAVKLSGRSFRTFPGLIDAESPSAELLSVECGDGGGRACVFHLDETETLRSVHFPVDNKLDTLDLAVLLEEFLDFICGGSVRQIAHIDTFHSFCFLRVQQFRRTPSFPVVFVKPKPEPFKKTGLVFLGLSGKALSPQSCRDCEGNK